MPQVSAAVLRSEPSSTIARHSIRRDAETLFARVAAARSSAAVKSSRVIATAFLIEAAPPPGSQHRVRLFPIWESPASQFLGPLVSVGVAAPALRAQVISGRARAPVEHGMATPARAAPHSRPASFRDLGDEALRLADRGRRDCGAPGGRAGRG